MRGARLSDTVAKLNARLAQMTAGHPDAPTQSATSAPSPAPRERAPLSLPEAAELGFDQAVAEIAARQRMPR